MYPRQDEQSHKTWRKQEWMPDSYFFILCGSSLAMCVRQGKLGRFHFSFPPISGQAPSPLGITISRSLCPQHPLASTHLVSNTLSCQSLITPQNSALRVFCQGASSGCHSTLGPLLTDHSCSIHWGLSNLRSRPTYCFYLCFSYVSKTETVVVGIQEPKWVN